MTDQLAVETPEVPVGTAPITTPEAKPVGSETATPAVPATEKPAEKTFTQAELEREIGKRLAIQERRRTRELEAQVKALTAAQAPKPQTQASTDAAPKRDDFDSYDEFIRAEARHVAREEFKAARAAEVTAANEAKATAERETNIKTFDERMQAAAKKYEDFGDVYEAARAANVTDAMFDAMTATEEGAEIVYFFGKNPEEAHRIAQLPLKAQAVEIGKLAVRIAAADTSAANPAAAPIAKPAPVSKAPEPIKPVGGTATVDKPWDQLTDKEFAERRRRQIAQRR